MYTVYSSDLNNKHISFYDLEIYNKSDQPLIVLDEYKNTLKLFIELENTA